MAPTAVLAGSPVLKTPGPVIYLSDNLDEADGLGWCIDTLGRGYAEDLQAHSCKPQGGDVQFQFLPDTQQIQSVAFPEKCMTLVNPDRDNIPFGLTDCDGATDAQRFAMDGGTSEIHPASDPQLCVSVGANSRQAGPFMSRDLVLTSCADTANELKTWSVKP